MIRFGLKILALPICFVLCVLGILSELLLNLYSYGAGLFINFIILCLILAAVTQEWMNFGILAGILLVAILLTLCIGIIYSGIAILKDSVKDFIAN